MTAPTHTSKRVRVLCIALPVILAVSGCAHGPILPTPLEARRGSDPLGARCLEIFRATDQAVHASGVADAQSSRIPGFPYLRSNRFLASFRDEVQDPERFSFWVDELARLDREARRGELRNLPPGERARLSELAGAGGEPVRGDLTAVLDACSERLERLDLSVPGAREALLVRARVPDSYQPWKRVAGLYLLTLLPFAAGVHWEEARVRSIYAIPTSELPAAGTRASFVPPCERRQLRAEEVAAILRRAAHNPLQIPLPEGGDLEALYHSFAPVWSVDVIGEADLIGAPRWDRESPTPIVDTGAPTVYRYLTHTRFGGAVLLQLNYGVWFPERPATSSLDLLAGRLDGITWRVTLGTEGRPLLYDTMHNCGCWHWFYPSGELEPRAGPGTLEEFLFVPQAGPRLGAGERTELRISHTAHWIERVLPIEGCPRGEGAVTYVFAEYDRLRALPQGQGAHRSLFGPDGLVAGSERAERWLFWPMGIASPGAMRQAGHHATAFIGRRHFDDPFLIEERFEPKRGQHP